MVDTPCHFLVPPSFVNIVKLAAETKRDSLTWKHPSSPVTKKFKVQRCTAKVIAIVFWGAKGVILKNILPQRQCINTAHYCSTFEHLRDAIRRKRTRRLRRVLCFSTIMRPLFQPILNSNDCSATVVKKFFLILP
ncbi:histone-lysine N-methyltransferase SETMAR [Elysia marginata]|uniref:Histone-lysine N-methyltransferase SETMAR n=1 Tax=Elysia marginata TaxID=1093978 RepID=A0AAV4IR93_9GAST|nr:histone-lysine N-methyltransferase SETMAR [Elysia marginata]